MFGPSFDGGRGNVSRETSAFGLIQGSVDETKDDQIFCPGPRDEMSEMKLGPEFLFFCEQAKDGPNELWMNGRTATLNYA